MKKSFTLIEILVVIVVIGVLSAFILVGINSISDSASVAKGKAFANSLRNSLLTSLVSEWKFDETGTTTIAKDSWLTYDGTLTGFVFTDANSGWRIGSQCVSGGCLSFDGLSDYVSIGNISDLKTQNFTVFGWLKSGTDVSTYRDVITSTTDGNGFNQAYHVRVQITNGLIFARSGNGTASNDMYSTQKVNDNKWHFFSFSNNKSSVILYTDGIITGNQAWVGGNLFYDNTSIMIGSRYGYFSGLFDEIKYYNQALSTSKINEEYKLGLDNLLISKQITQSEYSIKIDSLKFNLANNE